MASVVEKQSVLVTGGLGFIGSSLAVRLVRLGADVTVLDSSVQGCGANLRNLAPVIDHVRVLHGDIANAPLSAEELRGFDVIFNLAGEISHVHSMRWPDRDAYLNASAQLRFLDRCAREAPGIRIVYASTRQLYGSPEYLPVDEEHPVRPIDFNGIHKYAATQYHLIWSAMGKLDARVLCLTNIYGPRMAVRLPCQGFLGHFFRQALTRQTIEIFGDGEQLRDPLYIDDAVDTFVLAGAKQTTARRVWNIGTGETHSLRSIAEQFSEAGGCPEPVFRPFPAERKRIDIGSYYTDATRFQNEFGWRPRVSLKVGICRGLEFFRAELPHYLLPEDHSPSCTLDPSGGRYRVAST